MTTAWRSKGRALATVLGVALVVGGAGFRTARADDGTGRGQGTTGLATALETTRNLGAPTVVLVVSDADPAAMQLWSELSQGSWARSQRGLVQLVRLTKERDSSFLKAMNLTKLPAALVYVRGPKGLLLRNLGSELGTAESLAGRLSMIAVAEDVPGKLDPSVGRAAHGADPYPSSQYAAPPPPLQTPVPQPQPQPTLTLTPAAPTPTLTSTAGVVQVPGQNFVIQQGAPQIFIAPAQSPVVYVPQTTQAAPTGTLTLAAAPAQPAATGPTLTLSPSPVAVTAPAPTLAVAAVPAAPPATAAVPVTLAAGAPTVATAAPALAAVTNQTLSLPANASRTRIRVRGPGIVASSLARVGERLIRLGQAKIETVQETTLEAPYPQSSANGVATISTTQTSPITPPPQTLTGSIPQVQIPPPCPPETTPPPATPSPQSAGRHGH